MSRGFRSRLLSAGVVALALTATACGGSSSSSTGGGSNTSGTLSTLTIANAVKVDTLDPEANSVNESIWLDQNLYSRLLQPNATGTGLLPDLATVVDDLEQGPHLHLPPAAQCRVLQRHAGHRQRRRVLDRAVPRVQGRLGLPADPGQDHHRAGRAHRRDHAVPAARAAAGRPRHVRLLGRAGEPGQGPGRGLLHAPGRQRAVHGHLLQPRQRGRPGPQPALLRHQAQDLQGQDPDRAQRQHPGARCWRARRSTSSRIRRGTWSARSTRRRACSVQLFPSTRVDFIQLDEHFAPFKKRGGAAGAELRDQQERDRQARLPGPRGPGRLVHAVQDGVLRQLHHAVPV